MGGPRPTSWAPIGLPSCFLSWVGWVGPGSDGWAAAKKLGFYWAYFLSGLLGRMGGPLPRSWALVGLPSCFLLSGLLGRMGGGWVGRGKEAGLPLAPFMPAGSDGWAAAKKLGSRWVPFMFLSFFLGPGSDG